MEDSGNLGKFSPLLLCIIVFILAVFLSLLVNALSCCRRARLRLLAEGNKKYTAALDLLENVNPYQASLRGGIIFLLILSGYLGGLYFYKTFMAGREFRFFTCIPAFLFLALGSGLIFFTLSETLRELARAAPEKITAFFLPLIKTLFFINYPLLAINRGIASLIRRFLPGLNSAPGMTEAELKIALLEGEKSGVVESKERTMVEGVFYLGDRPVSAFMTHRPDIKWLDLDIDSQEVKEWVENAGEHRYFPVASEDLDKVCGIVSIEDLLLALLKGPWPGLKTLMRPPYFVPETMPALKSFEAFKKSGINCLFVMDEYGGFAGMLTVKNLIEEITGQLSAGEKEEEITVQEDGTWLADGSLSIDNAAQAFSLSSLLSEGGYSEYHTLAGFILNLAGEIPKTGAHFDFHGFRFTVTEMNGNRIDKLKIAKLEEEDRE